MKIAPTMIVARIAFYLAMLALVGSVLTISFADWGRFGVTGAGLLKLTDTFLLMSIAMILAASQERRGAG